jgi:DNA-directed RNA polymerase subunit RPC12/RpoP
MIEKQSGSDNESLYGAYVPYRKIRCPKCGSKRTRAYCTKKPFQYRKCLKCGKRFRASED